MTYLTEQEVEEMRADFEQHRRADNLTTWHALALCSVIPVMIAATACAMTAAYLVSLANQP